MIWTITLHKVFPLIGKLNTFITQYNSLKNLKPVCRLRTSRCQRYSNLPEKYFTTWYSSLKCYFSYAVFLGNFSFDWSLFHESKSTSSPIPTLQGEKNQFCEKPHCNNWQKLSFSKLFLLVTGERVNSQSGSTNWQKPGKTLVKSPGTAQQNLWPNIPGCGTNQLTFADASEFPIQLCVMLDSGHPAPSHCVLPTCTHCAQSYATCRCYSFGTLLFHTTKR